MADGAGGFERLCFVGANSILCFGHASIVYSRVSSSAREGLDVEESRGEDAN